MLATLGWISWRAHHATMVRLDKLFGRWQHSVEAAGFAAWTAHTLSGRRREDAVELTRRALLNLAKRDLSRAWHSWTQFVARLVVEAKEAVIEAMRHQAACTKAVRLLLLQGSRALAAATRRWQDAVRESKRAEACMRSTLGRLGHRALSVAWRAWRTRCSRA